MKKEFSITEEQLKDIANFKERINYIANDLRDLCLSEKEDIYYGFTLGTIHSQLKDLFIELDTTIDDIKVQELI